MEYPLEFCIPEPIWISSLSVNCITRKFALAVDVWSIKPAHPQWLISKEPFGNTSKSADRRLWIR